MTVPSRQEVQAWSKEDRARVARTLDELLERPPLEGRALRMRRAILVATVSGVVVLLPWVVYLSLTLPATESGGAWRTVWVGFDVALAAALGMSAWLAARRRQLVLVALVMSATLVLTDAWFDVCLSWHTSEQRGAFLSAFLLELPIAALLMGGAFTLMQRTAATVARLRGMPVVPSLWRLPIIIGTPSSDSVDKGA